ncbi:MAG TPA: glycosyltransferase family 39 protein [Terriglobales bacterium]|nr:glycosyltransferase family 39 protein [Terriglobales bacterium]
MGSAAPQLQPATPPDWRRRSLPCVALLALLLRLGVILFTGTYHYPAGQDHFRFGFESGSIARSVAAGEGFASPFTGSTGPTAWIAPAYPYLCAVVFKMLGAFSDASAIALLALNGVFAALTCFPVYELGRRTFSSSVGWWSALLWSAAPHFMKWSTELVWETSLSALLVMLALLMTLRLAEAPSLRRWLLYGVLWGAIALTNPVLVTLLPIALPWIWRRASPRSELLRNMVLSMLLAGAMFAPWLARNRIVFGQWVFLRSNFGFELHLGNYHGSFGMGWGGMHPSRNRAQWERYRQLGEMKFVEEHRRAAMEFIREYPGEFVSLCGTRFLAFWDGASLTYAYDTAPWTPLQFAFLSVLAAGGLLLALVRRRPGAGLLVWIVLYPAPYYITYPQARYRHPVEPVMLLLAAFFASVVAARVQSWITHSRRRSA